MSGISTGVGLISGLDISSIVDSLMSIERRPRDQVADRQATVDAQRTAVMDLSAQLSSLKMTATTIRTGNQLSYAQASSSNTSILKATASNGALPATYQFRVARLVQTQQNLSGGFADTGSMPFAAGTLTLQSARARLTQDVELDTLNAQTGVSRGSIRITDRSGASAIIDLGTTATISDVIETINSTSGVNVQASADGGRLVIEDLTGQSASNLAVSEVSGGTTAADLGLAGSVAASQLTGSTITTVGGGTALSLLNGGTGVRTTNTGDDLRITLRDGSEHTVDLTAAATLGDVLTAFEAVTTASGGNFTATLNASGTGLTLSDASAGGSTFAVAAENGSRAALDLGLLGADYDADGTITGTDLTGGLEGVLLSRLNGGAGVERGEISITDRDGAASTVDLREASTIQDVIDAINDAGVTADVTASLNSAGNGIVITDNTGGAGNLVIAEVAGATTAADLGIAVDDAVSEVASGDLNRMFVNELTTVASLNGGKGINRGTFEITDSLGVTATVDLTQGNEVTLQDVIDEINSRATSVTASINATGDGLLLTDTGGGPETMTVSDATGTSAADLGIAGTADGVTIDGSSEVTIDVEVTDTLTSLTSKINASDARVQAGIVSTGSAVNPYRLSLVSEQTGSNGAFIVDGGATGISFSEIVRGRDAVVALGDGAAADPVVVTSSTNTVTGLVEDVTLDLVGADADSPVTVTVSSNTTAVVSSMNNLVVGFNKVIAAMEKYTAFDAETLTGAILQGDATVNQAQQSLSSVWFNQFTDTGSRYSSLSSLGFTRSEGELKLDEDRFREVFEANPDDVRDLLTDTENGFLAELTSLVDRLAQTGSGSLSIRATQLERQSQTYQTTIDNYDSRLESKRERLTTQFINMEKALAQLQAQQSALQSLASLAASYSGSSSSSSS